MCKKLNVLNLHPKQVIMIAWAAFQFIIKRYNIFSTTSVQCIALHIDDACFTMPDGSSSACKKVMKIVVYETIQ